MTICGSLDWGETVKRGNPRNPAIALRMDLEEVSLAGVVCELLGMPAGVGGQDRATSGKMEVGGKVCGICRACGQRKKEGCSRCAIAEIRTRLWDWM